MRYVRNVGKETPAVAFHRGENVSSDVIGHELVVYERGMDVLRSRVEPLHADIRCMNIAMIQAVGIQALYLVEYVVEDFLFSSALGHAWTVRRRGGALSDFAAPDIGTFRRCIWSTEAGVRLRAGRPRGVQGSGRSG